MGRRAYFSRIAFGRYAWLEGETGDTPTQEPANDRQRLRKPPRPLEGQYPEDIQQYDNQSCPINPRSRELGRSLRAAANDILAIVGIVRRGDSQTLADAADFSRHELCAFQWTVRVLTTLSKWWIRNIYLTVVVFPVAANVPFPELVTRIYHSRRFFGFFFAGLPAVIVSHMVSPNIWKKTVVYLLDRLVWASIQGKERREFVMKFINATTTAFGFGLELIAIPFRCHSVQQASGLVPESGLFPSPNAMVPFTGTSLVRFGMPLKVWGCLLARPMCGWIFKYVAAPVRLALMSPKTIAFRLHQKEAPSYPGLATANLNWFQTRLYEILRGGLILIRWEANSDIITNVNTRTSGCRGVSSQTPAIRISETEETHAQSSEASDHGPVDSNSPITATLQGSRRIPQSNASSQSDGSHSPDEHQPPTQSHTIRITEIDATSRTVNLDISVEEEAPNSNSRAPATAPIGHQSVGDGQEWRLPSFRMTTLLSEPSRELAMNITSWICFWWSIPVDVIAVGILREHWVSVAGINIAAIGMAQGIVPSIRADVSQVGILPFVSKIGICFFLEGIASLGVWCAGTAFVHWTARNRLQALKQKRS